MYARVYATVRRWLGRSVCAADNRVNDITNVMRKPALALVVPFDGNWRPVEEYRTSADQLFHHYLDATVPDDEVLAASLLVRADDTPWNTTDHAEEFRHVENWLHATSALLDGAR